MGRAIAVDKKKNVGKPLDHRSVEARQQLTKDPIAVRIQLLRHTGNELQLHVVAVKGSAKELNDSPSKNRAQAHEVGLILTTSGVVDRDSVSITNPEGQATDTTPEMRQLLIKVGECSVPEQWFHLNLTLLTNENLNEKFLLNGGSLLTLKHQSLSNTGKFETILS